MPTTRRRLALPILVIAAAGLIAIPVLAASPSPSTPPGETKPDKSPNPNKPDKAAKPDKGPELALTAKGTIQQAIDDQGRPTFTLTVDGKTWDLSAGPSWYWGDKNPLKAFVGKSVTVVGSYHDGDTELDVESIDGTALREGGKPPWAGGPWVIGESHPGWKPWMADGKPGNGRGRETAPGQLKDKSGKDGADSTDDADEPAGD